MKGRSILDKAAYRELLDGVKKQPHPEKYIPELSV